MRALPCDCGQYLKAEDKEALFREVQAHLKREDRPRHHPLGWFLEEEQDRQLVAERSYTLQDVQEVVYAEGDDGWEEGFESLFFDYAESMRAVVLGTRAG
jgi:SpoVK/Ycf46/Vps4 family AAA+-type ATPase